MKRSPISIPICLLSVGLYPAVLSCATGKPADATVPADAPAVSRLVVTLELEVPYGEGDGSLGFVPAGDEHEALGPNDFEVKEDGAIAVSDPVRRRIFEVSGSPGSVVIRAVGALPPRPDLTPRYDGPVRVFKASAEAGEVIFPEGDGERRVAIAAGGPLAALRLIGVDRSGRAFLVLERFVELGRSEVERELLVVTRDGGLVARSAVEGRAVVAPIHEFALADDGALYRMVAGDAGVTITRYALEAGR